MSLPPGKHSAARVEESGRYHGFIDLTAGRYEFDEVLQWPKRMTMTGKGTATEIHWPNTGPAIAFSAGSELSGGVLEKVRVLGAPWYTQAEAGSEGLRIGKDSGSPASSQITLRDVWVHGFEKGINSLAGVICRLEGDTQLAQNVTGFSTGNAHRTMQTLMTGVRFEQNLVGMRWSCGESLLAQGCLFQENYGEALVIGADIDTRICQNLRFVQSHFEKNCRTQGEASVVIRSPFALNTRALVFEGMHFTETNVDWDIDADVRSDYVVIRGNHGRAPRIKPTA